VKHTHDKTLHELRETFPRADKVGQRVVFDVGGNKYRIITVIHFNRGKLYVRDG
jgi:mRNA interferase HigB